MINSILRHILSLLALFRILLGLQGMAFHYMAWLHHRNTLLAFHALSTTGKQEGWNQFTCREKKKKNTLKLT